AMKFTGSFSFLLALLFSAVTAPATVIYVDINSASPTPPYTNWNTAATNIQDAVDVATTALGTEVLVTNGIYKPVVINKALDVRSVNGPIFTMIDGNNATQC